MSLDRHIGQNGLNLMYGLGLTYIHKIAVTYTQAVKHHLPVNALVVFLKVGK